MVRLPAARLSAAYKPAPYWWDGMKIPEGAAGPLPAEVDVLIVGTGFTGLGAALELSRRGRRVVAVDREQVAWGASSRNGGIVHPGGKHALHEMLAMPHGQDLWNDTVDAFDGLAQLIDELGIDCQWQPNGYLELAHHPRALEHLRQAETAFHSIGEEAHMVAADELSAEIGSSAYFGGLVVERGGAVHPGRLSAGLAGASVAAGAQLFDRTDVRELERATAGYLVRTSRGTVRAREVVVATNGYTGPLVPWLAKRILPIGSYIIATEQLDSDLAASISPRRRVFFDTKNFLFYWRLSPDGTRVLFGGRTSFAPTTIEASRDVLYRSMLGVHPQLSGVALDYAWGGNVALTGDRMPHLGRHAESGLVFAMGYSGTGVAMATHFGRAVGRWLADDGDLPPYAARPWAPVPLPARVPQLLPVGGWWYQARDRLGV